MTMPSGDKPKREMMAQLYDVECPDHQLPR